MTSSGCLWRGYFTNTQATNQRDVTPFYIIRQHGEEKNEMEFVNFITQGDKLICGWWCAAPKWDLLHPWNCVKSLKREGSSHAIDSSIDSPVEVRLETYKFAIVRRRSSVWSGEQEETTCMKNFNDWKFLFLLISTWRGSEIRKSSILQISFSLTEGSGWFGTNIIEQEARK